MGASQVSAALLFTETWQSGRIESSRWRITKDYPGMKVVSTPNRLGINTDKAILFELGSDTWRNCPINAGLTYGLEGDWFNCHDPATEIRVAQGELANLSWNKTYWYGWSVYFPGNFGDVNMIFTQWHDQAGITGSGPGLAFRTLTSGDVDVIIRNDTGNAWSENLFRPQSGRWYDFVVHAKIIPDNSGFADVWVYSGGQQIASASYNGPLGHHSPTPSTYLKMGLYIPNWRENSNPGVVKRVVIDEIRIGDNNSSVSEVSVNGRVRITPSPLASWSQLLGGWFGSLQNENADGVFNILDWLMKL